MMWIKMGISEGDNGGMSFRLYKVRGGRWNWWCVDEAHSATTPVSLGVSGLNGPLFSSVLNDSLLYKEYFIL